MVKKTFLLSLALFALTTHADEDAELLDHARPLIEDFLKAKGEEYGVDLTPAPATYRVRVTASSALNWPAYPIVSGTRYDYHCRRVTVALPERNARARFYVRRTYDSDLYPLTTRFHAPTYTLVRSCSAGLLGLAPQLELKPRPKRVFEDEEVLTMARNIVSGLRPEARLFATEHPSRLSMWEGPEYFDVPSQYDPIDDCRVISFALPDRRPRVQVGVHILYGIDVPNARHPAELQTIIKDPASVRSYRIELTRGCYGGALFLPPKLPSVPVPAV